MFCFLIKWRYLSEKFKCVFGGLKVFFITFIFMITNVAVRCIVVGPGLGGEHDR